MQNMAQTKKTTQERAAGREREGRWSSSWRPSHDVWAKPQTAALYNSLCNLGSLLEFYHRGSHERPWGSNLLPRAQQGSTSLCWTSEKVKNYRVLQAAHLWCHCEPWHLLQVPGFPGEAAKQEAHQTVEGLKIDSVLMRCWRLPGSGMQSVLKIQHCAYLIYKNTAAIGHKARSAIFLQVQSRKWFKKEHFLRGAGLSFKPMEDPARISRERGSSEFVCSTTPILFSTVHSSTFPSSCPCCSINIIWEITPNKNTLRKSISTVFPQ